VGVFEMAIAISLKTESGDDYLFCYEVTDKQDLQYIVNAVAAIMGEEMAYVYDWSVCDSNDKESTTTQVNQMISTAKNNAEENVEYD
jgi:hypothetical protein